MTLQDRPYAGNWIPNARSIVEWTPDCLVYINGDTALPGCSQCNHKIDLQPFITNVSVESGVDPSAASATISFSIPKHYGDSLRRDGASLLCPGLEVHVYFRGYFPVTNLIHSTVVQGVDLSQLPQYPYYPVFHGVVTAADEQESGGYITGSLTCNSMLHFWQYINMCTSGSLLGVRPLNSHNNVTLRGNNFNGMSPFSIIYSLYMDVAGAAGSIGFALQQTTNVANRSEVPGMSMYSLSTRYWERRFSQGMYGLKMYGVSGRLFNAFEQAHFARGTRSTVASRADAQRVHPRDPFYIPVEDLAFLAHGSGEHGSTVRVDQMHAFVDDVSQWGSVNLFESTYESKLDVANQAALVCGYEFFQDPDGDLVFKPPLYNLNTRDSRIYVLEPSDIISVGYNSKEPEATYMTCKGSTFRNLAGLGLDNEWGVQGTFIDYRLVGKFGWRPATMESAFYSDSRSAFYAAAARLAVVNAGINSCTVTIPLRPELRPGFPVYIKGIDCYYYLQSFSHSFTFGGQCTTSLQLVARRAKFHAPGDPSQEGLSAINLGNTLLPPKPLKTIGTDSAPKLVGFPNVVMALDPEAINPLHFLIQPETLLRSLASNTESTSQLARNMLIRICFQLGIISRNAGDLNVTWNVSNANPSNNDLEGPWYILAGPHRGFQVDVLSLDSSRTELRRNLYDPSTSTGTSRRRRLPLAIRNSQRQIDSGDPVLNTGSSLDPPQPSAPSSGTTTSSSNGENAPTVTLMDLLDLVQQRLTLKQDTILPSDGYLDSSANLLDLLSGYKASFTPNVAGEYRYYSSSHPDKGQQGPKLLNVDMNGNTFDLGDPVSGKFPITNAVRNYPESSTSPHSGLVTITGGQATAGLDVFAILPVAYRRDSTVTQGTDTSGQPAYHAHASRSARRHRTRHRTAATSAVPPPAVPHRATISTQDIFALVFQYHAVHVPVSRRVATPTGNSFPTAEEEIYTVLFNNIGGSTPETYGQAMSLATRGGTLGQGNIKDENGTPINYEGNGAIQNGSVSVVVPNTGTGTNIVSHAAGETIPDPVWFRLPPLLHAKARAIGTAISNPFTNRYQQILNQARQREHTTSAHPTLNAEEQTAITALSRAWSGCMEAIGVHLDRLHLITYTTEHGVETRTFTSPVFPVSDGDGYELVGVYQYGRGFSVGTDSNFARLMSTSDPLRTLTSGADGRQMQILIEQYVRDLSHPGTNQQQLAATTRALAHALETNPTVTAVLKDQIPTTGDQEAVSVILNGLRNYYANTTDRTIQTNNNAYSLAELNPTANEDVCSCRGAEADLLLAAYMIGQPNGPNFLAVDGLDPAVQAVGTQMAALAGPWATNQAALRGVDSNVPGLVQTIQQSLQQIENTASTAKGQAHQVSTEARSLT